MQVSLKRTLPSLIPVFYTSAFISDGFGNEGLRLLPLKLFRVKLQMGLIRKIVQERDTILMLTPRVDLSEELYNTASPRFAHGEIWIAVAFRPVPKGRWAWKCQKSCEKVHCETTEGIHCWAFMLCWSHHKAWWWWWNDSQKLNLSANLK